LRRDFAGPAAVSPRESARRERARRLFYLGAAGLLRGRRDYALAAFRRLVRLDPRYRPDRLLFPPEVSGEFDSVRVETRAAPVVVPRDTAVRAGILVDTATGFYHGRGLKPRADELVAGSARMQHLRV
jgi:hypothetical protein